MIKLLEKLLNLIYIQPCYFCRSTEEDSFFCSKCYSKIKFRNNNITTKIQNSDIYSATVYEGIIKILIIKLKYYNKKKLAYYAAKILNEYWNKIETNKKYIILPVPIHKNRKKERKYNHMDLVSEEFSKLTNYEVNKNFLIRIKDTKKQYNLHREEREKNIKDAFKTNNNFAPDKEQELLILDDITATGTTLNEIIKLLKEQGYNKITALTIASPDILYV